MEEKEKEFVKKINIDKAINKSKNQLIHIKFSIFSINLKNLILLNIVYSG